LTYEWSCFQIAPSFDATCGIILPSDLTTATIDVDMDLNTAITSVNIIYLIVRDKAGSVAPVETSVEVDITAAEAPSVEIITSIDGEVSPSSQLSIQGTAAMAADGTVVWSSDYNAITLSEVSLTATSTTFTNINEDTTNFVNLVIRGGVLPSRSTITFTLTATLNTGQSASTAFQVTTSGPPVPGVFTISPAESGMELSTTYTFAADLWSTSSLPLSYEFGFISASGNFIVVQSRSESPVTSGLLPAGPVELDHYLTVRVVVYDSKDSSTNVDRLVKVNPSVLSDVELNTLTTDSLNNAGDADSLGKVIGTTSEFLNRVDCSKASDAVCASLNRHSCATVEQTCGECMSDFYGLYGASNNPCVEYTQRKLIEEDRLLTSGVPMTCPQDCNTPQGVCSYHDINTMTPVDACDDDATNCVAMCKCNSGFYGSTCSLDDIEMQAAMNTRGLLVDALLSSTEMQNVNNPNVASWMSQLAAITQMNDQLSIASITKIETILSKVTSSLSATTLSTSAAASMLNSADRIAAVIANFTNSVSEEVVTIDGTHTATRINQLEQYGNYISSTMVSGQESITSILNHIRISSGVEAISGGVDGSNQDYLFSSLLTPAETSEGVVAQFIDVPIVVDASNTNNLEVSMIETRAYMYDNVVSFNSHPLRVNIDGLPCSYNDETSCDFSLVLKNYRSVTVSATDQKETGVVHTTSCAAGETTVSTLDCSQADYSHYETVTCTGVGGTYTTRCPHFREVSKCVTITNMSTDAASNCMMTAYDETSTFCTCSIPNVPDADWSFGMDYVSATEIISEGYEQTFEAITSAPSSQPSEATEYMMPLFPATDAIKKCFSDCNVGNISTFAGEHDQFCPAYQASSCDAATVGTYGCMPDCMPSPDCGEVFCSTFATMSKACGEDGALNGVWDVSAVKIIQQDCFDSYANVLKSKGLGVSEVEFDLSFTLPGVDFSSINNNNNAQQAIYDTIATLFTGVRSVTGFTAIDSRRRVLREGVRKLLGNAVITVTLSVLPSIDGGASDVAAAYSDQMVDSMDHNVFQEVLAQNVVAHSVSAIIPQASIDAADSSSVVVAAATFVTTASPTQAPTFTTQDEKESIDVLGIVLGVLLGFAFLVAVGMFWMKIKSNSATVGVVVKAASAMNQVIIANNEHDPSLGKGMESTSEAVMGNHQPGVPNNQVMADTDYNTANL
jgi:hypothetical protein